MINFDLSEKQQYDYSANGIDGRLIVHYDVDRTKESSVLLVCVYSSLELTNPAVSSSFACARGVDFFKSLSLSEARCLLKGIYTHVFA